MKQDVAELCVIQILKSMCRLFLRESTGFIRPTFCHILCFRGSWHVFYRVRSEARGHGCGGDT